MTTKNYFQARLSQGKMNEDFFKSIIEKDIKEKLKKMAILICLILKMKIIKLNLKQERLNEINIKQQLLDMIKYNKD